MTGIAQRHIAGVEETTTEMAAIASERALRNAGVSASKLDLIVACTITPDLVFPSTGALLQARLGAGHIGAFDISAACSGFLYGLAVADAMVISGRCRAALVVGSERMSQLVDWNERSTCVLFGDGAGAAVVVPDSEPGIRSVRLHADGSTPEVLRAPSTNSPFVHMDGGTVFRFAVRGLVEGGQEVITENGMPLSSIDWLIPHQANLRIIQTSAHKLGLPMDKVVVTVDRHANTSAASIPLALDVAVMDGRVRKGHEVMLLSVGGGFTWASSIVRWK
jgi:3-oxoacyl-[acyl-carrier-protein] synthase-3